MVGPKDLIPAPDTQALEVRVARPADHPDPRVQLQRPGHRHRRPRDQDRRPLRQGGTVTCNDSYDQAEERRA